MPDLVETNTENDLPASTTSLEKQVSIPAETISTIPPTSPLMDLVDTIFKLGVSISVADSFGLKTICLPLILSHLNGEAKHIASIALILTTFNVVLIPGISPLFAINIEGSRLVGELQQTENEEEIFEKRKKIADLYRNGLIYSLIVTPGVMGILIFSGPILHRVFNQDEVTAYLAQDFLRPYSVVVFPSLHYVNSGQIISSFQYTKAMRLAPCIFLGSVSAALLLGFECHLGLDGVLLGYMLDPFSMALLNGYFTLSHSDFQPLNLFNHLFSSLQGNASKFKKLLWAGSASTLTISSELTFSFGLTMIAGTMDVKDQEAFSLIMQYTFVNFIVAVGFALAGMIIMGNRIGSNRMADVYPAHMYSQLITILVSSICPLFFAIYPDGLMKIFGSHDEEISNKLKILAPIVSIGVMIDAKRFSLLFNSRALKDMNGSAIVNGCGLLSGVLLAFAFKYYTHLEIYGVGLAYTLGMLFTSLALEFRIKGHIKPYREEFYKQSQSLFPCLKPISSYCSFWKPNRQINAPSDTLELRT